MAELTEHLRGAPPPGRAAARQVRDGVHGGPAQLVQADQRRTGSAGDLAQQRRQGRLQGGPGPPVDRRQLVQQLGLLVLLRTQEPQQGTAHRSRDPLASALSVPADETVADDQQAQRQDNGQQAQQRAADDAGGNHRSTRLSTAVTLLDSSRGLNGLMM